MYLATKVERWAVREMLDTFQDRDQRWHGSSFPRLHRQVTLGASVEDAKGGDIGKQLLEKVRTDWCNQVQTTRDPVAMLLTAKALGDLYLQAYTYFFILKLTNGSLAGDRRLTIMDHLRLMNGFYNLRRYDSQCGCRCSCGYATRFTRDTTRVQPADETLWSPRAYCNVAEKFDKRSLWEMFEYSPTLRDNLSNRIEVTANATSPVSATDMSGLSKMAQKKMKMKQLQKARAMEIASTTDAGPDTPQIEPTEP
jgi:hypothetical protein